MAIKKKYKKMTNKEKQFNKEIREDMRERGILPPVKPKLNRNKFAKEVIEEYKSLKTYGDIIYLSEAIGWMLPSTNFKSKVTPEQIGVLKVLKLAVESKKFQEELKAKGETQYSVGEFYEKVIAPILKL